MGDYYIELVFDAVDRIDIGRGCYILYNNHRFEIMNNVIPDDTNQGGLRYTLRFESQQSQMKRCNVFWREGDNLEVSFALTSDISTFGQLIIDNVNAFLGGSTFSLGSVPSGAEMKTISFAGDSCWDAVATIAETFGVEWWTEEDGDNVRLCFGKLEVGESVEFKKGDIVSSIPSKKGDDANYGTRFYVFGSTKNLPEDYGSTVEGGITNNIVEKRLHLPNGMQYIDAWPNLAPEDIVEKTVFFEDVMPTNVETITEVYSGNAEVIPGTSHKVYDVVCANSPFTLDDVIEGETIQANFTSGSLNGQTFDLELTQTSGVFNKTFRIVPKILDKDSLTILPQGEMIPRAGDTFILLNVNLPKGRIDEAEQRLLEVGREYVKKNSSDTEIYDCPTNAVYCHKNDCNYVLGQRVTLVGDMFGNGRQSRIQGYEKKLYDEYQATYTVGDNSAYSRLASLEKSIRQANYSDRVGLEANIIRSKNDSTIPSDFNVYSALTSEEMFLSKRRGGIVKGHTNFEKGISMYGIPIVYDEETKTWVFEGNLVATRGIAAFSSLSTPVASIFEALPIDGTTIKRNPITNELYVDTNVVGGSGGGSLDEEQIEEYLKPYAKTADVASTYATKSSVNAISTQLNDFLSGSDTDAIINKWSELETFLAGLAETDNLATILSGKANKATTLAGYGITDAYTKSHIDSNFVTIGTKQQITGEKDFVGGFKVNGGLVEYNATLKAWVLNGDLLVTGGMAAFSNISGFNPSTITDAVLIDDRTIKRNSVGALYVASGSDDGGIDEAYLAEYLTANSYAKKSDINSALTDYATQSWVTGRGYITSSALEPYALKTAIPTSLKNPNALSWSGYSSGSYDGSTAQSITIPNNTNQLNNGAGFITSITSSMVTNALGYTPLSTGGGTITGAGANPLTINRTTLDAVGLLLRANNIIKGEFGWASASGTYIYNAPSGGLLGIKDDGTPYFKGNTLLHSGNYSDYALPKDSTAVAATTLKTSTGYMYARAFNVDKIVDIGADATFQGYSTYIDGMYIRFRYGSANATAMQIGTDGNVSIGGTTATEKLHVYGVAKATLLKSAQGYTLTSSAATYCGLIPNNIITGSGNATDFWLYNTTDIKYQAANHYFVGGNVAIGGTTASEKLHVNGKGLFADATNPWVALQRDGVNWYLQVVSTGLKLGRTSALGVLIDDSGNMVAPGGVTATNSSDERLKQNIRKFNASKVLMSLGGVYEYEYIDREVQKNPIYEGTHYGLIYQHVKGTKLDVMCHEREDGMGALNYIHPKFISLIAGATMDNITEVETLKREIRHLKQKVKQLENRA
jgi:hypothetical protein